MVTGLNVFRDYFADDTDKYVLIGGAACDIVFTSNDAPFRATKDLDMVQGYSYADISRVFHEEKIPVPSEYARIHSPSD